MILAETVKIDGGTAALILGILLLFLAAACSLVFLGFFLAHRAARGSALALGGWLVAVAVEVIIAIIGLDFGEFVALVMSIVGLQVAFYLWRRSVSQRAAP